MTNEEYARGLRELADVIEGCDVELYLTGETVNVLVYGADEMAEKITAIGGKFTKHPMMGWFVMRRKIGGHDIDVFASHEAVCERVVIGTETVEVPDPSAPMVTIEREVVEWKCPPSILKAAKEHA